jgi:hypothetical protein
VFILAMACDLEVYSECGRRPSFSVPKEHGSAEKCFGNWIGFRPSLFLSDTLDQVLSHLFLPVVGKKSGFQNGVFFCTFGTPADGQAQK